MLNRRFPALIKLHLVVGLVAGLFLVILGATGALIAFEPEIEHGFYPTLYDVEVRGQPLPLTTLDANVASALKPNERIGVCLFPASERLSYAFTIFRPEGLPRQIFVNQYTGQVLGTLSVVRFTVIVRQLHVVAGLWGCSALFLMFLVITGLYLWWPLKRIGITPKATGRRLYFDLHSSVGFLSSLFLLLFAATGTYMAFYPAISSMAHSRLEEGVIRRSSSADQDSTRPISVDDAVSLARHFLPGATPIWVVLPERSDSPYMVKMRFPEDRSFNGSSAVWLDRFSGRSTQIWNSRTDSLGGKLNRLSREVHTGDALGYSGKLIACFMSLTLIMQTITGICMWWKTRAKPPHAAA
jgi:uncharacterized iron-regulated membrane protein